MTTFERLFGLAPNDSLAGSIWAGKRLGWNAAMDAAAKVAHVNTCDDQVCPEPAHRLARAIYKTILALKEQP